MSVDEQYVAFPKLFGAPAYARPPVSIDVADRPFDPDDLPLMVELTPEERAQLEPIVMADCSGSGIVRPDVHVPSVGLGPAMHRLAEPALRPRPFALRSLANRLRLRSED